MNQRDFWRLIPKLGPWNIQDSKGLSKIRNKRGECLIEAAYNKTYGAEPIGLYDMVNKLKLDLEFASSVALAADYTDEKLRAKLMEVCKPKCVSSKK